MPWTLALTIPICIAQTPRQFCVPRSKRLACQANTSRRGLRDVEFGQREHRAFVFTVTCENGDLHSCLSC